MTLSTVGYGDVYPVTPEGRVAASVLMLLGIGLFSAITASVTSYFLEQRGAPDTTVASRLRALVALHRDGLVSDAEFERKRSDLLAVL